MKKNNCGEMQTLRRWSVSLKFSVIAVAASLLAASEFAIGATSSSVTLYNTNA